MPNGLDYSGLSTLHTRIVWVYLEIANSLVLPNVFIVSNRIAKCIREIVNDKGEV